MTTEQTPSTDEEMWFKRFLPRPRLLKKKYCFDILKSSRGLQQSLIQSRWVFCVLSLEIEMLVCNQVPAVLVMYPQEDHLI